MGRSGRSKEKSERWSEDRNARRSTKGPDTDKGGGRERNVGHQKAEEHNRSPGSRGGR